MKLPDFAGRMTSLSSADGNWRLIHKGRTGGGSVFLGALAGDAPRFSKTLQTLKEAGPIYWLEAPCVSEQLKNHPEISKRFPPAEWRQIGAEDASSLPDAMDIWFYYPGLRLAPDYWGRLLASWRIRHLPAKPVQELPQKTKTAWLPGDDRQLLHQELKLALKNSGYDIIEDKAQHINDPWRGAQPDLVVSVNFRGLDPDGHIFQLCRALGIPIAVWLVDNPLHLLSGIRLPWWREASLFVTDPSFLPLLLDMGAQDANFLPLAASSQMFLAGPLVELNESPVFIGRSAFPDKANFFGSRRFELSLLQEAEKTLTGARQSLADYHWWRKKLDLPLWPGLRGRQPGLGAEETSVKNRALWLASASGDAPMTIYGDTGWRELVPKIRLQVEPVDYYAGLARLYHNSCVLNVTTLQLPESLNQRHFDVWAAGGLLLTDATRGLDIFPEDLVRQVSLERPHDFSKRFLQLRKNPETARLLASDWRNLIEKEHLYEHRLNKLLEHIA